LAIIDGLKSIDEIRLYEFNDRYSVYQALNILVPVLWNRDEFTLELRNNGVMASVHYPETLSELSVFRQYLDCKKSYKVSHDIAARIVTLPLFGSMTQLQVARVVEVMKAVVNKFKLVVKIRSN